MAERIGQSDGNGSTPEALKPGIQLQLIKGVYTEPNGDRTFMGVFCLDELTGRFYGRMMDGWGQSEVIGTQSEREIAFVKFYETDSEAGGTSRPIKYRFMDTGGGQWAGGYKYPVGLAEELGEAHLRIFNSEHANTSHGFENGYRPVEARGRERIEEDRRRVEAALAIDPQDYDVIDAVAGGRVGRVESDLSSEGTPEDWAFFDRCLSVAKGLHAQGKSDEEIAQVLEETEGTTPDFARYMAAGAHLPSSEAEQSVASKEPIDPEDALDRASNAAWDQALKTSPRLKRIVDRAMSGDNPDVF